LAEHQALSLAHLFTRHWDFRVFSTFLAPSYCLLLSLFFAVCKTLSRKEKRSEKAAELHKICYQQIESSHRLRLNIFWLNSPMESWSVVQESSLPPCAGQWVCLQWHNFRQSLRCASTTTTLITPQKELSLEFSLCFTHLLHSWRLTWYQAGWNAGWLWSSI